MPASMDWSTQGGDGSAAYQSFLAPAMFSPFAERLADAVGIEQGARVLDVACGTGVLSRAAARRAGSEGSVTGVDLGGPMLAVAEAQPPEAGAAPIRYLQGEASALPVEPEAFEVVLCQQGLQFFPDRIAALTAMRAARAAKAVVAVATWAALDQAAGFSALADALDRHIGKDAGTMMRWPFALADPVELARLFAEAGFPAVSTSIETLTVRFADRPGFARRTIAAGPVENAFASAEPAAQERVLADVAQTLQDCEGGEQLHFRMSTNVAIARG